MDGNETRYDEPEYTEPGYEMEELVPVVAKLSRKMCGMESSSITYEKAKQLMEAVLYCIREWKNTGEENPEKQNNMEKQPDVEKQQFPAGKKLPAEQAYQVGVQCVTEKVKRALGLYHEIMERFDSYGNTCLYDTMVKEIPEFFKWYDVRFCPQDTIITLDYPVGRDLSHYSGIDAIWEYLTDIREEQEFLRSMDRNTVLDILRDYCSDYEEIIENLRWIISRTLEIKSL